MGRSAVARLSALAAAGALAGADFWSLAREDLMLVAVSLAASILVGIPLGVLVDQGLTR